MSGGGPDGRGISFKLVPHSGTRKPLQLEQVFNFGASRDPLVMDGEPWFVAKDVCEVLEVDNSRQALTGLEEYEKDAVILNDTMGRPQSTAIINEPGLYSQQKTGSERVPTLVISRSLYQY